MSDVCDSQQMAARVWFVLNPQIYDVSLESCALCLKIALSCCFSPKSHFDQTVSK